MLAKATQASGGRGGKSYETYGDFANPAPDTPAGELAAETAAMMGKVVRDDRPMTERQQQAVAAYRSNPAAVQAAIEAKIEAGDPLSEEQTAQARAISADLFRKSIESGKAEDIAEADRFTRGYLRSGSAAGKALAARRESLFQSPEGLAILLQEKLDTMTDGERNKLEDMRKKLRALGGGDGPGTMLSNDPQSRAPQTDQERKWLLENTTPVNINQSAFRGLTTREAIAEAADREYRNLIGRTVSKSLDRRPIEFSAGSIKKVKRHSADARVLLVVPSLPRLLEQAIPLWTEANTDPGSGNILAYHHYGASAVLDGRKVFVRLVVREQTDHTYHYDHDVTSAELMARGSPNQTDGKPKAGFDSSNLSKNRLYQWYQSVKSDPDFDPQSLLSNDPDVLLASPQAVLAKAVDTRQAVDLTLKQAAKKYPGGPSADLRRRIQARTAVINHRNKAFRTKMEKLGLLPTTAQGMAVLLNDPARCRLNRATKSRR